MSAQVTIHMTTQRSARRVVELLERLVSGVAMDTLTDPECVDVARQLAREVQNEGSIDAAGELQLRVVS